MVVSYDEVVEQHMIALYHSLSEKDRRRYAGVEAEKLGFGGVQYIADLFDCDPKTIRQGRADVSELPNDQAANRIRKKGEGVDLLAVRKMGSSKRSKKRSKSIRQGRR